MTTIFIAGDSTAAKKETDKRPEAGWGEYLETYLAPGYHVNNHAMNGRSTKSFIEEGRLEALDKALKPGDFLFIQFGHNDQKVTEDRGTQPDGEYQSYLAQYVDVATKHDAQAVLLTSVTRRDFHEGQLNQDTLGAYPQAMSEFAKEQQLPLLDMYQITQDLYQNLGYEETKALHLQLAPGEHLNYPEGVTDNTHFNEAGAKQIAQLVAKAIKDARLLPTTV